MHSKITHTFRIGHFDRFDFYKLPSLGDDVEIEVTEDHKVPNVYTVGFCEGDLGYQRLFKSRFDNRYQAIAFAKDVLNNPYTLEDEENE